MSPARTAPLHDLIFELSEFGQSKICLAVCDDETERKRLIQLLHRELRQLGLIGRVIEISNARCDLADVLNSSLRANSLHVAIVDLAFTSSNEADSFFAQLNFRRDYYLRLAIPLCIFITTDLLKELIRVAPDFWSRRTATYYFTHTRVQELLGRLFEPGQAKAVAVTRPADISLSLATIAKCEEQINEGDQGTSLKDTIKKHIGILKRFCEQGESLRVTLALWIQAHMDEYIQRQLTRRLSSAARYKFQNIYEDKNDILFKLAERIGDILSNYQTNLDDRIAACKKVSLTHYFGQYAHYATLSFVSRVSKDKDLYSSLDSVDPNVELESLSVNLDDVLRNREIESFEMALQDPQKELPSAFTRAEVKVLRKLYNAENPAEIRREVMQTFGRKKLELLQDKVLALLRESR